MKEGAYELIKMIIENVDPTIQLTLADGNVFEVPVDPDMLLSELDNDQKQLADKDAMIDWFVFRLQNYCNNPLIMNCVECRKNGCHNNNWRKAAQEAVSKDA